MLVFLPRLPACRSPKLAVSVWEPKSGRVLEVLTTAPGVQFYSECAHLLLASPRLASSPRAGQRRGSTRPEHACSGSNEATAHACLLSA